MKATIFAVANVEWDEVEKIARFSQPGGFRFAESADRMVAGTGVISGIAWCVRCNKRHEFIIDATNCVMQFPFATNTFTANLPGEPLCLSHECDLTPS